MKKAQLLLAAAFLFTALALFAFFWTMVVGGPLAMMYRDVASIGTARTVANYAAVLGAACLFVAGLIVAIPVALRPGGWGHKLLYVLPIVLLAGTLLAFLVNKAGIGVTARLSIPAFGMLNLSTTLVTFGCLVAVIAVSIATARVALAGGTLQRMGKALTITAIPTGVAWLALVASLALMATTPVPAAGGPPGAGAAGGPAPAAGASGPAAPGTQGGSGAPAAGSGSTAPAGAPGAAGAAGGAPAAARPGGTAPGGPGRPDPAAIMRQMWLGSILMALFGGLALLGLMRLRPMGAAMAAASDPSPPGEGSDVGRTIAAAAGLIVAGLLLMQLVPVQRDNPAVVTAMNWSTPETHDLWNRACADCHSSETKWPWYAMLAPTSWITTLDVKAGRRGFNISELTSYAADELPDLPDGIGRRIKNGAMPPKEYLLLHPEARLTEDEKKLLTEGMAATLAEHIE